MSSVIVCTISLIFANFGVEFLMHDIPDYSEAARASWDQFLAISIYYWIWVKE